MAQSSGVVAHVNASMTQNVPISSALHLAMILLVLTLIGVTLLLGASARRKGRTESASKILGYGVLALWVGYNVYYFTPTVFRWDTSLPLHVCDLLGVIAALALIWRNSTARALLYFCALALAIQAIITPTGNQSPASLRFWLYWLLHACILAASIYDIAIVGFRPQLKDLRTALIADIAYVAVIVPLNIATGWNYGYLGNAKPDVATAVDLFGPWPARIVFMLLAVAGIQLLMYVPWGVRQALLRHPVQGK